MGIEVIILAILGSVVTGLVTNEAAQVAGNGVRLMGGLPVEMITMLGSSLLGGFMSIWGQSIKAVSYTHLTLPTKRIV